MIAGKPYWSRYTAGIFFAKTRARKERNQKMMNKEDNISLALLISIGALAIFAELNKSFINWFINYLRSLPDTLLLVGLLIVYIVLIFIIHSVK